MANDTIGRPAPLAGDFSYGAKPGRDGKDGRGIAGFEQPESPTQVIVRLTDGTGLPLTVPSGPPGAKGEPGAQGDPGPRGLAGLNGASGNGTGNVNATNTPAPGQIAVFTSLTDIEGVTALPAANHPALTGDVTTTAGSLDTTLQASATTKLNAFTGDTGTGGAKGLVPAPASGDAAAGKFLSAGGGWNTPSTLPAGMTATFATAQPPAGWLKCNGALVSRATYVALFSAIGTTFGAGDGSTTFALPDLRGEFVRGWDDGRGVDAGRTLGSAQGDLFKAHTHSESTFAPSGSAPLGAAGSTGSSSNGTTGSTGGTETRPRNVALLYCIKF